MKWRLSLTMLPEQGWLHYQRCIIITNAYENVASLTTFLYFKTIIAGIVHGQMEYERFCCDHINLRFHQCLQLTWTLTELELCEHLILST
jgi:hypothetical protein